MCLRAGGQHPSLRNSVRIPGVKDQVTSPEKIIPGVRIRTGQFYNENWHYSGVLTVESVYERCFQGRRGPNISYDYRCSNHEGSGVVINSLSYGLTAYPCGKYVKEFVIVLA
jgi:hypothetical protein